MEDRLSILISGPPNYIEGKLLGIVSMVDDQGKPSSKGNIQAKEVWKAWLEWGVAENIRVIVLILQQVTLEYIEELLLYWSWS